MVSKKALETLKPIYKKEPFRIKLILNGVEYHLEFFLQPFHQLF